jgi:hypothetical protein
VFSVRRQNDPLVVGWSGYHDALGDKEPLVMLCPDRYPAVEAGLAAPSYAEIKEDGIWSDDDKTDYWRARTYRLNNAISLLQQSLEIFLKARIAEVSPFLLISGEPDRWPKRNSAGDVDFSDFRTLDAVQLCKAVNSGG